MARELIVLITLLAYAVALLLIGYWASRRTNSAADFFIGGRNLGPLVAAMSASASSSSAWTLLGVSGAAFAWGLPALWLFPATLLGFVINWFWVAPRLNPLAARLDAVTLPDILSNGTSGSMRSAILRSTAIVIVISFSFYVASQFQAAGHAFAGTFGMPRASAIALGGLIVVLYTWAGGFWAVSVTDTLQGLLMAATAIVLPIAAVISVGGPEGLISGLAADQADTLTHTGIAAAGFAVGTLGIGLGYPGQPHVVNRLMALRDDQALRAGRIIAITWAVVIYAGMIALGLSGRVMIGELADGEQVFFALTNALFHPAIAGLMIAAVLSAIMSTADSQLLVVSSSIAHDWFGGSAGDRHDDPADSTERTARLRRARRVVLVLSVVAILLATLAPATIFDRVLFAWHAVGSALGPALILILAGLRIRPRFLLASIWIGFGLTVAIHWFPNTPGDWLERLAPLVVAGVVAALGRER